MKTWDKFVRLNHNLRGTNVYEYRREWIVPDIQQSDGNLHSGYPIVSPLNVGNATSKTFFLNNTFMLKEGNWGAFHEIGHNMQRDVWTFNGTRQVTCNIFTLYTMDSLCNCKPWIHSWVRNQLGITEQFLKDGADYEKWKSKAEIALFVYAQLAREFGWESYKKVFLRYETMTGFTSPRTDQEMIDTWFVIFLEVVEYNLAPLAHFWNIPLSSETVSHLKKAYPVGFLYDEVTRFAPGRVSASLQLFPGTARGSYKPA